MIKRVLICDGCHGETRHPDIPAGWVHLTHRVPVGGQLVVENGHAHPKVEDRRMDFCGVECLLAWAQQQRPAVCSGCLAVAGQHTPTCPVVQGNLRRG